MPDPTSPPPTASDEPVSSLRPVALTVAVAMVVRMIALVEEVGSPFYGVPVLDEAFYHHLAVLLAEGGDPAGLNPGFRPWLYSLVLAGLYAVGGASAPLVVLVVQHLLGVLTAAMVADLGVRLAGRPVAGAAAGTLFVLAGPPLFFEGRLLITTLFTFLVTLQVWTMARAGTSASRWAAAGAVTALSIQARANALVFLALYPAWAILARGRNGRPSRRPLLAAAVAAAVVLLLFALLGHRLTGQWRVLPAAGGVNLYLGNALDADGRTPVQDRPVSYGAVYRDSVQVWAEDELRRERGLDSGASLGVSEVSRYWTRRALHEVAADPGRWLGLMARKMTYLLGNAEIPNNLSYDFVAAEESRVLPLLPVRFWLLLALLPAGTLALWRRWRDVAPLGFWLTGTAILHAAAVLLFFVNGRFRLPLWPLLAVVAGVGATELVRLVRASHRGRLAVVAGMGALLAAVSLAPWPWAEPAPPSRDLFFRSLVHLERGDAEKALDDARRSLELDPDEPATRFQLGNAALALGDVELALRSFAEVVQVRPDEPRVANNVGVALERAGRAAEAYGWYLRALALAPDYAPALVNAALHELRAGDVDAAEPRLEQAVAPGYESVSLLVARAVVAERRGRRDEAARLVEAARAVDPVVTERLLREMGQ